MNALPIPILLGTVKDPVTVVTIAGLYRHFALIGQTSVFPLVETEDELLNDLWYLRYELGAQFPAVPVEFYLLFLRCPAERSAVSEFAELLSKWGKIKIAAGKQRGILPWRCAWTGISPMGFPAVHAASPEDIGRIVRVEDETSLDLLRVATDIQNGEFGDPIAREATSAVITDPGQAPVEALRFIRKFAAVGQPLRLRRGRLPAC